MSKTLKIRSSLKDYSVKFYDDVVGMLKDSLTDTMVAIIDQNILDLYPYIETTLGSHHIPIYPFKAEEESKNIESIVKFLTFLQQEGATSSSTILAIGGGITQEIGTFAAHTFYRGVNLIYVPTTLLAMADSCIGAKCAVNFNGYKNQLGFFHPSDKVLIWPGFVHTLSEEAYYSGLGEIFKLMIISGESDFQFFADWLARKSHKQSLNTMIYRALEVKKIYIERDEFDKAERRILNYGHSFGHAIESATNYSISHGCAVILGIDIANFIAMRKSRLTRHLFERLHQFIDKYLFKFSLPKSIELSAIVNAAKKDKKVIDGKLNMVLLNDLGNLEISPITIDAALHDLVSEYFNNYV